MIKVGITGGIGSGKSMVCKMFAVLGAPIYDADARARFLMENDPNLIKSLKALFGEKTFIDNQLDRKFVAAQVFNNTDKLTQLNALVHPCVGEDFDHWTKLHADSKVVIKEAALMFESDSYKHLDKIITVFAPEDIRIKRVLKRDPFRTEADIKAIISNQFAEKSKLELADFVILNDDKQLVIPQVLSLYHFFC
jgi:dephospho-CoA kinase